MILKTNDKGFTIVEVLVALSISSMLMLALLTVMIASSKSYDKTTGEVSLENESQTAMNFITNLLSKAQYIEYNNKSNATLKKRYMVELEQTKLGKADPNKDSDRWAAILGSVVSNRTYLAVGTDFKYNSTTSTYSMTMHYVLYDNDKLYYYKTQADDMNVTGASLTVIANNELLDDKQDDLNGIVGEGNKYLLANYVDKTDGFSLKFDEEITNDDANNDMLTGLKVDVEIKFGDSERKFNAVSSIVPRNSISYIYN